MSHYWDFLDLALWPHMHQNGCTKSYCSSIPPNKKTPRSTILSRPFQKSISNLWGIFMRTMKLRKKIVSKVLKTTLEKGKRHELRRRRRAEVVEFLKWVSKGRDTYSTRHPLENLFKTTGAYSLATQVRVLAVGKLVRQFSTPKQMVFVRVNVRLSRLSSIGEELIAEPCAWMRSWM